MSREKRVISQVTNLILVNLVVSLSGAAPRTSLSGSYCRHEESRIRHGDNLASWYSEARPNEERVRGATVERGTTHFSAGDCNSLIPMVYYGGLNQDGSKRSIYLEY